ncbi:MAG: ATP-binding cassette domain-containing protein [Methanophagales archaeon]|jgi:ABC-type hemin transport system ATPase subunit|nr:ATP-binding cassette domain-containing protein [Methanophagales archaeon]
MIEIENLTKKFNGVTALNSVSFRVNEGEIFAYLGSNGAGKTTTVNISMGAVIGVLLLCFFLPYLLRMNPIAMQVMVALAVAALTFMTYFIATKWFNRERLVVGL